jgi:hypothetical protein
MVGLVVVASIHMALYVQFSNVYVYLNAKWVGSCKYLLYVIKNSYMAITTGL